MEIVPLPADQDQLVQYPWSFVFLRYASCTYAYVDVYAYISQLVTRDLV